MSSAVHSIGAVIPKAEQIRTLRLAGFTVREIAERVGCSFQYAHQVVKKMPELTVEVRVRGDVVIAQSQGMRPEVLAARIEHALERLNRRT